MKNQQVMIRTVGVCVTGLVLLVGLWFVNKQFLSDAYIEEIDLLEADVPPGIVSEFRARYPAAQEVVWQLDNKEYAAAFVVRDELEIEVYYSKAGDWVTTETDLPIDALPASILEYLKQEAGDRYEISTAEKVETREGTLAYAVDLESMFYEWTYRFDQDGKFIERKRDY